MTVSQGSLRIQRLCRLAGVSRSGYYRFWQTSAPRAHDTAVRSAIQRLALANGRHRGYRYISHQLRRDEGIVANHKCVLRLMREDNLCACASGLLCRARPTRGMTGRSCRTWRGACS